MPLDKSIHHKWKNGKNGGLYYLWNSQKPSRKCAGGFYNDVVDSWVGIPQEVYQNAIEGCRDLFKTCFETEGKM